MTSGKSRSRAADSTLTTSAIFEAFVAAMEPVIRNYLASGVRDHGAIADALNRRGVPCWGHDRWMATDIRMVLSRGGADG
jgi:hypothetical protein